MSKQIPELTIITTPTAGQESIIETVVARHDTYETSRMTLAQIFTLGSISGAIKSALDTLSGLISGNTSSINTLSSTKLNIAGGTRTGLTANRAIITDGTGVETYLTGTTTQVIGFDGAGKPIAINISSSSNSYTAGETIAAGNAVYIASDGLVYKAGTVTTFLGFAQSTVSASQSVVVDTNGITATQSGLSIGTKYYLVTSTPSGNTWANKTAMTTARYEIAISVFNNKVYCIGGTINGTQYLQTNEEYNPATNTWTTKANMTTGRYGLSSQQYGNKIYCIGGYNGGYLQTNEEYDPSLNTWASKTAMTTARIHFSITTYSTKIYCIGGYNGGFLATNEEYDPSLNTWATKTAMTTARQGLLSQQYNNKIYCIGGDNGAYLATNQEYDPVANTWAGKTSMGTARHLAGSVQSDGFIYVFGGETTGPVRLATSEAYDVVGNTWSSKASMVNARYALGAGLVNGKAYVIGGANGGSGLSFNEEYTLPTTLNSGTITTTPNSTKVGVATSATSLLIQTNF